MYVKPDKTDTPEQERCLGEGKSMLKEAIVYFRAANKAQVNTLEKELSIYAIGRGLNILNVLYDCEDGTPITLFALFKLLHGRRITLVMPSPECLRFEEASPDAMKYYLKSIGIRTVFMTGCIKRAPEDELMKAVLEYNSVGKHPPRFARIIDNSGFGIIKNGGKLPMGYKRDGMNTVRDTVDGALVGSAFELFAQGLMPAKIAEILERLYPKAKRITRNQLYSMIKNPRYIGAFGKTGDEGAAIVGLGTWLKAFGILKKRSGEEDAEPHFLITRVFSDGKRMQGAHEERGNKLPYYTSGDVRIYALEIERAATDFIVKNYLDGIDELKRTCLIHAKTGASRIESALETVNCEVWAQENEVHKAFLNSAETPNMRSAKRMEKLKVGLMLRRIEQQYLEHLYELYSQSEASIAAFFDHFKCFNELSRIEKQYFLDVIIKRVDVYPGELVLHLLDVPPRRVHIPLCMKSGTR